MGNEARSANGYRVQIRATVGTPASGDDIQNINTRVLPDGALCLVLLNRGLYQLDKSSVAAASGFEIVLPIAGPGRWVLMGGPSSTVLAALYSTLGQNNSFTVDGSWSAVTTSNFIAPNIGTYWSLTAAGGVLTYTGPRIPAKLQLIASVAISGAEAPYSVYAGIRFPGQLSGALAGTQGGVTGANFIQGLAADDLFHIISSQRVVGELFSGDVIQPVFGSTGTGESVAGTISSLQLIISPP